jgi:surfeit locus 1 family protein
MLGNWQYARYSEKIGQADNANVAQGELLKVMLERPEDGFVQQVYGKADSKPLWRRYALGQVAGNQERLLVLIEATEGAQPVPLRLNKLPSSLTFQGNIIERTANRGILSPKDQPEANVWNTMDPQLIGQNLGLDQTQVRIAEPLTLTVINAANPMQSRQTVNPYAFATPVDPLPPERHFGYALTWWGMALGLIGVYLALHHSRGRLRFRRGEK